jgi:2-(1,2-epoxy-1,2-dihydrophenyl)acetyl-CoA isomerase
MAFETLLYEVAEGICTITLNRPEKINSFNNKLHKEYIEALKQAEKDPAVRCVVLTGAGRGFCSGQDLSDISAEPIGEIVRTKYNVWVTKMRTMEKPIIAAVNGVAAGAGAALALAADLIILSDKASMVLSFVKVGLVPDTGASFFLPRLVGYHKAMEIALLGEKISAEEALRLGLANQVVPAEEFVASVQTWATKLAQGPKSMGWIKRMMNRGLTESLPTMLEQEAYLQEAAGATADAREAITAFMEKRAPQFQGK